MVSSTDLVFEAEDIEFGNPWWFFYAGVSCLMVLFAGIMSGLTLGLMSLNLVELEILQRSGTCAEKKQAGLYDFYIYIYGIITINKKNARNWFYSKT